jgi:cytochrome c-type biogenesis protein CcmH/NrfG
MKCNEILERMPDLAAGMEASTPEVDQHLKTCTDCVAKLEEFRQTMALLDEWQAPEPSPYFDTRLQARLREEKAKQPVSWWSWVRRPVLAGALAVVAVVGITVFEKGGGPPSAPPLPGTAVSDLSALDKNGDMYANFDELDDLQVQPDVNANP